MQLRSGVTSPRLPVGWAAPNGAQYGDDAPGVWFVFAAIAWYEAPPYETTSPTL